ncbi:MAG: tail fiber domain-containing protein [Tannerella sp.]|jgi:hypothetical protein|nr:tail fiber domain-containing protein [Tannerella sp.]
MKKKLFDLRVAIATIVFMMVSGIASVNAQFLYENNHICVGQVPTQYQAIGLSPQIFLGPKFGIEYKYGGINIYIAWNEQNYGDYKFFLSESGNVGIGREPTTYKLEVAGQVWTTAGLLITSDSTQKKNIRNMGESRSDYVMKLKQLNGKTYEKLIESGKDNAAEVERMVAAGKIPKEQSQEALRALNERKKDVYKSEYGFIAQDIKKLFPELVEENAEGILAVNYTGLIPVLLEAIKDLQDRVEKLEKRQGNDAITIRSAQSPFDEEIEKVTEVVGSGEYLSQNAPNPIYGSTVIRYNLPEGTTKAVIIVYSTSGSIVKTFPLDAQNGSITLYASDLAKGVYVYNLTANGIVLGSRKMINP